MEPNESFNLESRYEHHFDTLLLRITKPYKYKESVEIGEGIILDFDEENVPVALEILNASKIFKVPKYALNKPTENIGVHMGIKVDEKSICLKADFAIKLHNNRQDYSVESFTANNSQIPNLTTELATA